MAFSTRSFWRQTHQCRPRRLAGVLHTRAALWCQPIHPRLDGQCHCSEGRSTRLFADWLFRHNPDLDREIPPLVRRKCRPFGTNLHRTRAKDRKPLLLCLRGPVEKGIDIEDRLFEFEWDRHGRRNTWRRCFRLTMPGVSARLSRQGGQPQGPTSRVASRYFPRSGPQADNRAIGAVPQLTLPSGKYPEFTPRRTAFFK